MSEQVSSKPNTGGTPFGSVKSTKVADLNSNLPKSDNFITFLKPDEVPLAVATPKAEQPPEEEIIVETAPEEVADEIIPDESEDSPEERAPEPEEDDDVNPYEYLGKQLKSDGFLDPEFEVSKKVKGSEVYSAYQEKLRKEIEPKIYERVKLELEELGVNELDLNMARMIRAGTDVNALQNELVVYERFSGYSDEAPEEVQEQGVRAMHLAKGLSEEDSAVLVSNAKEKEQLKTLYKTSSEFFKEKYVDFVKRRDQQAAEKNRIYRETVENSINLVRNKLSAGEIYGDKLDKKTAKEIEDAIFTASDIYEENGQKIPTSKFNKFLIEFNNNPELKVWAYKKYAYKDTDLTNIKKEVSKQKENEFLDMFKKDTKKKVNTIKAQSVKKQLEQKSGGGSSYFVEF